MVARQGQSLNFANLAAYQFFDQPQKVALEIRELRGDESKCPCCGQSEFSSSRPSGDYCNKFLILSVEIQHYRSSQSGLPTANQPSQCGQPCFDHEVDEFLPLP